MSKTVKILITLGVFTFIILFFTKSCTNGEKPIVEGNSECERLNEILKVRAQDYFQDKLPIEDGVMKSETVQTLIDERVLTSKDLSEVGTSCTGNAYVGKSGTKYYYSHDINCGACTSSDLYSSWSEYSPTAPDTSKGNTQVELSLFYNYSDAAAKYTEWTDWVEKSDTKTSPVVPSGVQVLDTETEGKTQYSYRDGTFKWYRLTGGTSYYGGGAYYETRPASGYEKETETKTLARTIGPSVNRSDITSQTSGREYELKTSTQYRTATPKYIYSRTVTSNGSCASRNYTCNYSVPTYRCYYLQSGTTTYNCTSNTQSSSGCYYNSSSDALNACSNAGYLNCAAYSCTESSESGPYVYSLSFNWKSTSGITYSCAVRGCTLPTLYTNSTCRGSYGGSNQVSVQNCMLNGSPSTRRCSYNGTNYTACWSSGSSCNLIIGGYGTISNCSASYTSSGTTSTYGYKYYDQQNGLSSPISGYNCTPVTSGSSTKVYSPNVISGSESCPSNYPYKETYSTTTGTKTVTSCGSECTSCTEGSCTNYNQNIETRYLKSNGGYTTNINEAAYLTEEEKNKLGASSYTKTSKVEYNWSNWTNGSCPGNTETSTCKMQTLYSADIYKFKWFKTSASTKTMCNDGAYSASSPASGCKIDTSSAKWGSWSEYGDEKIDSTDTREVRTKVLKRMRTSYLSADSLKLEEYLPLSEFETKMGKPLSELETDTNISIQKKVYYKYRTLLETD